MLLTKEFSSGSESNCAVKGNLTRRRRIRSCESCRLSKCKCSKPPLNPCPRCIENGLECVVLPQDDEGWEVIEKGKQEHQKIHKKVAKRARREGDSEDESEYGSDIEPSPLIATDAAYEDDDDFEDNGVRVGRYNLTKRIGTDYRPKMMEELTQMLDINDLYRTDHDRQVFNSLPSPPWLDAAGGPKADPDFIAPSLFSHNLRVNQHIHKILRSQELADRIMEHYWERVHPVARIVYRPSFQERYDVFWDNAPRRVKDTPESTQALVYAALFAGVVSMDAETVREELGGERERWVKTLEKATVISLSRAHVIRTEKPETMQAFVMYLTPMCRNIISRTLATLVASAIDLARGMGLNRDGTCYGYGAVVTQVHRMIWHQLCFLDIRVCEAQSPRARIRKDDFNTQYPLNVDDSELEKTDLPKESSDRWTSMTLSTARMECNEKIREIYAARQRARQGDDSDSAYIKKMLEMISEFRQYMEKKYYPMIDDGIAIQHYTRLVIDLNCRRMHAMVLHEYHMSTPLRRLPEQWNQTVIKSGLETMEIVKEIETSHLLRPWRWYAGALQQHMYATLMLIEVFAYPGADYAMRAWESMDWIFEVPSCVPHNHKARWVIEGTVGVLKEYLKVRKLRCPTTMDERLGMASSSPLTPKSPKLRKIAARPTKTATMAHSRCKGTPRSGQSQLNPQGTASDNYLWTPTSTILPDQALPQVPVTSNIRASLQDTTMTSDAQAMLTDEVTEKNTDFFFTDQEPTIGNLLASAPHHARLERVPSESNSFMYTTPDSSPNESIDSASSWQSMVDSDLTVDHSGCSPEDNVTRPSTNSGSQGAEDGRGLLSQVSRAGLHDFTQDHSMYCPHSRRNNNNTVHLQNPPYTPTGDDYSWRDDSPHDHSRSNSHNNSQIIDEGSFVHFSDYPSFAVPRDSSGFTPTNQDNAMPSPLQQYDGSPYAGNVQFVVPPTSSPQPEEFGNMGPSDFE